MNLTAFDFFNSVDDNYGIEADETIDDEDEGVSIPHSSIQLTDPQLRSLQSLVNVQTDDGNHGINHYQQVVQHVNQVLQA